MRVRLVVPALVVLVIVVLLESLPAAAQGTNPSPPEFPFREVAAEAGITFQVVRSKEKRYILESMNGGVAVFDFNNDDLLDIYFVNAPTLDSRLTSEKAESALYKNLGGMKFIDVTKEAGVADPGWGMGACVADVDGDNLQDLYVTTLGQDRLYRNKGDGTFEDIAAKSGIVTEGFSTGCAFADYDRDGDLDLFVSRYVRVSLDDLPTFGKGKFCRYKGLDVQCGPRGLPGSGDFFFRNDGKGKFKEVAKEVGVSDPDEYYGMGVSWFDGDKDGWLDLFVANDAGPNYYYSNQKDGTFMEDAFPMGVAVSEDGSEQGCMGVAIGDFLNNGRFSLFVTNFAEESNAFYLNEGSYFTDFSFRTDTAPSSLPYVAWGTTFLDYDNDGWLDLMSGNGHVYPQVDSTKLGGSASYRQRKLFYRNKRDGTFEEIGEQFGPAFTDKRVSRGLALGDLDNDGRLDAVLNDLDHPPQILHNQLESVGNWLLVKLEGKGKMTDAIGAVITVRAEKLEMRRLVRSGSSYLSQEDMRQHFGLGKATKADSIEVEWPDGSKSQVEDIDANQIFVIQQP